MCSLPSLHAVVSIYVDEYSAAVISIHVDECSQKKLSYAECNALENITAEPTVLHYMCKVSHPLNNPVTVHY